MKDEIGQNQYQPLRFDSSFILLPSSFRRLGRGGSSSRTTRSISGRPFFSSSFLENGGEPVSSSYSSTPSAYTSERVSMSRLLNVACSGDMYCGVPTTPPKPVSIVCSVSAPPVALATPKSLTFTTGRSSSRALSTLEG